MPSMDHHHLRCTHKETEPRRFQISMFTFPEGSPGWIQTQAVWWENLCPSPLSRRLFWLQQTSAVGHRRGQTGCNYVMGFLKSQTKELNLKLLTLGSHHQFLRESVLWDWSGGKTSIVLCNSTNSYVESLFSFLIIPELHESWFFSLFEVRWRSDSKLKSFSSVGVAKSLQLCPTLCDPMDCSPPGSTIRGIL